MFICVVLSGNNNGFDLHAPQKIRTASSFNSHRVKIQGPVAYPLRILGKTSLFLALYGCLWKKLVFASPLKANFYSSRDEVCTPKLHRSELKTLRAFLSTGTYMFIYVYVCCISMYQ